MIYVDKNMVISNMKGKHQEVRKRFLDINPKALYTLCGCHM